MMMMRLYSLTLAAGLIANAAAAQTLTAQVVTPGLSTPVGFVQNPALANVQHVIEKAGVIRTIQNGVLQATPFLDITAKVQSAGEQGLLGLAFAPDYATSGRFYVSYVRLEAGTDVGNSVISRFRRSLTDPLRADPASEFPFIWPDGNPFIAQPFANHKGGNIAFGPDGMLYFGLGDGGSGGDPGHRAQNPATLLGKMLRLNVNVLDSDAQGYDVPSNNPFVGMPGVLGEIWAFGYRNPWRWSFDDPARGGTGAMVIGDVGQNAWEEIDYEPANAGGRNYGWRLREGRHDFNLSLPPFTPPAPFPPIPLTEPIHEYPQAPGAAVTGGFVYRGTALGAAYAGRYFFADSSQARVWSLGLAINGVGEASVTNVTEHTAELGPAAVGVVSFGVDNNGELYIVVIGGTVYRVALAAPTLPTPTPAPTAAATARRRDVRDARSVRGDGRWHLLSGRLAAAGDQSADTAADTTDAPPTPTPTAPPSASSCTTPDPFAAFGGGTCYQGGWLPPGITPPAPPTTPRLHRRRRRRQTPPTGGTCVTPDPFTALGGGTCYQGGWLPPGITPPSTPPTTPPTTPPPRHLRRLPRTGSVREHSRPAGPVCERRLDSRPRGWIERAPGREDTEKN